MNQENKESNKDIKTEEKKNTAISRQPPLALNEGHKNTILAALSYISILVFIPLLAAKEDSFVKFHIKQGLVIFIIEVGVYVLGKLIFVLLPLLGIVNIILFIFSIIGIINVVKGREKGLPLIGGLAKNLNF